MKKHDEMIHIKSGGRQIGLYADLGGYFYPDGNLNESAFRESIHKALQKKSDEASAQDSGRSLSAYLERVFEYLEEKGMGGVNFRLFQIAVDEAAKMGIGEVSISPQRMRLLLATATGADMAGPDKKPAPDEKRRKIFESALKIFTERGFSNATMDEIAALSGVAKGTIYRHFKSKDDLFEQLLTSRSDEVVKKLSGIFSVSGDVLDQIREFIVQWLIFIEENHLLYRLIQTEGINSRFGKGKMFYEHIISSMPMIKERIVAMNKEGKLKTMSFHTVAYGMLGFIDGVALKWFRSGMDYSLRDEAPVILEVLFNGFAGSGMGEKVLFVAPK